MKQRILSLVLMAIAITCVLRAADPSVAPAPAADRDWKAYEAAGAEEPSKPFTELSEREQEVFAEAQRCATPEVIHDGEDVDCDA